MLVFPLYCTLYLIKELKYLSSINFSNSKKLTIILGGAKISSKIGILKYFLDKCNNILIGGAMAFTFLKYYNLNIGKSLFDSVGFKLIPDILDLANICKTKTRF